MKTLRLICCFLLITLCVVVPTRSQPVGVYNASWALLVGINKYEHLPPQFQLNGAVNDVTSMRQLLIDHFGFSPDHIITLTDEQATKASILDAMGQLTDTNQIHPDDRVLIFYSGHGQGVKLPNDDEMGFLIPHDAKIDLTDTKNPSQYYRTCLGMDELRRVSRLIPAKHVLFLVDACYGGLAAKQYRSLPSNLPNYLQKVANLRARQIITAGKTDEQVFEQNGHGIFTYKLLEALEHGLADQSPPDHVTTAMELASYLMGVVPADSGDKQHPHAERIDGEGEFIFVHRRQAVPKTKVMNSQAVDRQRPEIRILEPSAQQNRRSLRVEAINEMELKLVGIAIDNVGVVNVRVNGRLVPITVASAQSLQQLGLSQTGAAVRFETVVSLSSINAREIAIQASDAAGNSEVIYHPLDILRPDTRKPTIEITEPAGLQNASSFRPNMSGEKPLRLAGIARDNIGVTRVTVNGRTARTTVMGRGTLQFETTIDLRQPATPTTTDVEVEISAYDASGNVETLTVTIEAPKPQPSQPDDMVFLEVGEFMMGSSHGDADAKPVHTITLDAFYIDKYEVTNAQFKTFIDANPQWAKESIDSEYHNGDYLKRWDGNRYPAGKADHPVVFVSWYTAVAYAQWVGKRLPTEAEWEKAARGGLVGKTYAWGDTLDTSRANFGKQMGDTTPIGTYPPNHYGLHDMAGNVWEWCIDVYDSKFYSKGPQKHPVAGGLISKVTDDLATLKAQRILRGGSWDYNPHYLQVGLRNFNQPSLADGYVGFRCVRSITR